MIQAEKTPELMQYMEQISGVVNYVSQTFSLFGEVEKVRPQSLLTNIKNKSELSYGKENFRNRAQRTFINSL